MLFDRPATTNPIDQMKVVGQHITRIDGPKKVTGTATYAYEWNHANLNVAYGYPVGAGIAKGRISSMDIQAARNAPGVLAVVTAETAGKLSKGKMNAAKLLGGPEISHYHQAIAVVVAETFEQARAAASLIKVDYVRAPGSYDLEAAKDTAKKPEGSEGEDADTSAGNFDKAFAEAAVKFDQTYTTPDQSHAMMEPHSSLAMWDGDEVTVWTSNQMIAWNKSEMAITLGIDPEKVHIMSPFVGGGFGSKLFLRSDAVLAALGAKAAGRPVKLALPRPFVMNNTTHRPATIQRIRIGTTQEGKITAIAHESWNGNLPGGSLETAVAQTRLLYAGENRMTSMRLAALRSPGCRLADCRSSFRGRSR